MDMNWFEHAADTRMTHGQSMSNLSRARPTEFLVPAEQNGLQEEGDQLRQEVRELKAQVLHAVAVAMTAAIWFVIPVAGLFGIYYMTGSAIAPLCLAGGIVLIGAMNYLLVNW